MPYWRSPWVLETILILVLLLALGLYTVVIYNALVAVKHAVSQSWSNIDVLLKQRK
jgi:LemA protein